MNEDEAREALKRINSEIGVAEGNGNRELLKNRIAQQELSTGRAPVLAFRRAGGVCVDARAFFEDVKESDERQTEIESINFYGSHRAVVTCLVKMSGKTYHNLRLFIRSAPDSQDWKLLGWANEPL